MEESRTEVKKTKLQIKRVIHLTESRWPKSVNMAQKLTTTSVNMVNMTKNIINIVLIWFEQLIHKVIHKWR